VEIGQWYTPSELQELPELGIGQADTRVGETGTENVWYGRTEDSPPVSVETLVNGRWITTYEGNPFAIRINWANEIEING
jgi:hypothetical protein